MNKPLVSIIMPVYNREKTVARAVDSVLAQTYPTWELIVVDDGSTDGTGRVLEKYGSRLTLIHQANQGPYVARNAALARAKGEFVAFLDSDDFWFPNKLDSQVPLFNNPAVGLVFGDAAIMDYRSGKPKRRPYTYHEIWPPQRGRVLKALLRRDFIPTSSVIVRRECFQTLGMFSLMGKRSADYAQWVKIAQTYVFDYVKEPVFELAIHESNWSRHVKDLYQSQIPLFAELMDRSPTAEAKTDLRQFLFNNSLNLFFSTGTLAKSALPSISASDRLAWFAQYFLLRFGILSRLAIQKFDSQRWLASFMHPSSH